MPTKYLGLYKKFNVSRSDGSSEPGGKHYGCEYFVLDMTHDKYAAPALKAYADACKAEYLELANDLYATVKVLQASGSVAQERSALLYHDGDGNIEFCNGTLPVGETEVRYTVVQKEPSNG